MIFISFNQLRAVYSTLFVGVIAFFVVFVLKVFFQYNRANLVFKNLQFGLYIFFYSICFIVVLNLFNFGRYNIALLLFYFALILFMTKTSKKLLDFFSVRMYHIYSGLFRWGRLYFARKVKSLDD